MFKGVSVLIFALGILFLAGCGTRVAEGEDSDGKAERPDRVPGVGLIVCERDGTRTLTPKVRARPEGVRFVIENRIGADAGASVFTSSGGEGANAPEGKSEHLTDAPPGKVRIGCEKQPVDGIGKIEYASFKVVDPDKIYKSTELECPSGTGGYGASSFGPGIMGEKGHFVERARETFSDRLKSEDVVELAGYPKNPERRYARVTRDGRVVATAGFIRHTGGWLQDTSSTCSGF